MQKFFVADVNKTFHQITDILRDMLVNEDAIQRVMRTAVGRSTMLVRFV